MEMLLISLAVAGFAIALDKLSPPDAAKVKRILARANPVPIDQVRDGGAAVVRGTVTLADDDELTAPLSGQRCVYWLVVFDEVGAKDFVELGRIHHGIPFLLRSEAGTARVIPERARVGVTPRVFSQQMPAAMFELSYRGHHDKLVDLAHRACTRRPNHMTTTLRAREYAVTTSMEISVSGLVGFEADPEAAGDVSGYREALPMRPVISGSRRTRLLIGE